MRFVRWGKLHQFNWGAMIEDHGNFESRARTVRWNQNLLPNQSIGKIVHLEGYMRNGLDRLGIWRAGIKAHPFDAEWAGSKSRDVNVEARHVNLVRARDLSGNSNVVKAPAMLGNYSRGFVVFSQMVTQSGISGWC